MVNFGHIKNPVVRNNNNNNNNNNKLNTRTDSKYRLCQQFDETIDHIILACPVLAKEQKKQKGTIE
jgi:hypothetical protein